MSPRDWKVRQIRKLTGAEVVEIDDLARPYPLVRVDGWFEIELHPVHDYDPYSGAHAMSGYEQDRLNAFMRWKNAERAL